jgi:hypothetical protein
MSSAEAPYTNQKPTHGHAEHTSLQAIQSHKSQPLAIYALSAHDARNSRCFRLALKRTWVELHPIPVPRVRCLAAPAF